MNKYDARVGLLSATWLFLLLCRCMGTAPPSRSLSDDISQLEPDYPCYVFHRMPKSGSSTTFSVIIDFLRERQEQELHTPFGVHQWLRAMQGKPFEAQQAMFVSGVYAEAWRAMGGGDRCKWFTVFRHPVTRVVSAYYHCKYGSRADLCAPDLIDISNMSFMEFAKFWSNKGLLHFILAFVTPEVVSKSHAVQAEPRHTHGWVLLKLYLEELNTSTNSNGALVPDEVLFKFLRPSMESLDTNYIAVGLLENWNATLHLFNHALEVPNLDWVGAFERQGVANTAAKSAASEKDETLREAWANPELKSYLWLDILLYEHAVAVHRKQLAQYGLA